MCRYQATLPDELDLRPGMKLKVLRLYDDAWGTAQVTAGTEGSEVGKQGAFPIVSWISSFMIPMAWFYRCTVAPIHRSFTLSLPPTT